MNSIPDTQILLEGKIARQLRQITEQWILPLPQSNPLILEMFRERDRKPSRRMVPFAGEFAGKYLTHAVQIYRLTRDERLKTHITWFVKELISLQADDGYLGPYPSDCRLTGWGPSEFENGKYDHNWDAWGHYHIMLGLLFWYETTGSPESLKCVRKIADLFCQKFLDTGKRLVSIGREEMNLAPIHSLCLLYEKTGEPRYLAMAQEIVRDFETPPAGDYVRSALNGMEFFQMPKPRWESLHPIQGIAELYFITSEEKYRQAFEKIWWSIVKLDRHNNGGFSSAEEAHGNPYHQGPIESCCTVAWLAMSVDMLRMSGSSIVADELEMSTFNAGLGMMSSSGRWVTYDTPMDGLRVASTQTLAAQGRPGGPELSCCAVNGPRALGIIGDWALMAEDNGFVINYYGPCKMSAALGRKQITFQQTTNYPETGEISIGIDIKQPSLFSLKLRIPYWSNRTRVLVNGKPISQVKVGQYLAIEREWNTGDTIKLAMDMSLHYWVGQKECVGKTSIYRGPILLAYDPKFNDESLDSLGSLPELDAANMKEKKVSSDSWCKPWLLWEYRAVTGEKVKLCDFASAGTAGNYYKSWLPVRNIGESCFSQQNPLRSGRVLKN